MSHLSINDYRSWYTNPSLNLDVRKVFAQTLILIDMFVKKVRSSISAKDVFRWKRGQESLIKFISTAQIDSFWEIAVKEYIDEMRSSERKARRRAISGASSHHRKSPSCVRGLFEDAILIDECSVGTIERIDQGFEAPGGRWR
jgi:hypothetical protein